MSQETVSLDQAIDRLAKRASADGIALELLGTSKRDFSASFQKGKPEKYGFSKTQSLGARVIDNGREGCSYTEQLTADAVDSIYSEARDNAKFLEKNYEPELVGAQTFEAMPWLYNSDLDNESIENKMNLAAKLESSCLDADSKITGAPYNGYSDFSSEFRIFNTKGVDGSYKANGVTAYTSALAEDGDNKGMAYEGQIGRSLKDLNPEGLAKNIVEAALKELAGVQPKSMESPVVILNKAANTFIGNIVSHLSAKMIDEKTSFFCDKLGQKVFSDKLSLIDDPFHKVSLMARPFDSEGSASQTTDVVKDGVLSSYLSNSVYAKKLGIRNTANASRSPETELNISPSVLLVAPGSDTHEQLLNAYPSLVLITELKGMAGFNPISGNFSIESSGYLYKNGKYDHALKNIVVSGNAFEVLGELEAIGDNPYVGSSPVTSPSLLFPKMTIAGK